ncbi:LysR family transcriptional regulator [Caballeronia sordidicola]|uniref:LysR family transcriptional regulator n=1 Tax=Caballeronia sordidicola TaxID=196367 RepID=A0A158H5H9_CABSO|nr:LysR family transcriptional regulator [Caballeronia sordidicola]SAL39584.1 LysR family transcriptional regulator [Caballeronia sordidicola]
MDTTRALNIFLSVARARNFSRAAIETGTSTPAISRAVAQLEKHLGLRLFHRTTRRVSLTAEGERLYELAEKGLQLLDDAMDRTMYAKDALRGSIRIAAPRSIGSHLLVPLMLKFQENHPNVGFDTVLEDCFTDLVGQKIDIGFRAGSQPDGVLISRPLAPLELLTCASRRYVERYGAPTSIDELDKHRCTGFRQPNSGRTVPWEFTVGSQVLSRHVSAIATFNDVDVEVSAVRAGMGIGQLPTYLVSEHIRSGELISLLPGYSSSRMGIFMFYPQRERLPARVRRFIDFVAREDMSSFFNSTSNCPGEDVLRIPKAIVEV